MILEYYRPQTIGEALELLSRPEPRTLPLGGGTVLAQPDPNPIAVVDVQDLGLDQIVAQGKDLRVGAAVRLVELLIFPDLPATIGQVIRYEANHNLRQSATVAGTLVSCSGRSPFACALLALNAAVRILPAEEEIGLGDLLPVRGSYLTGRLITEIVVPLNGQLYFDYVARSPADRPVVCAAIATWPSGRTRVALGGFGSHPLLAFDGPESHGAIEASKDAYSRAGDQWASADYRQEIIGVFVRRALERLP